MPNGAFGLYGFRTNADGSEELGTSEIYFRCSPRSKTHAAVARKALRLVEGVASNRCECVRWPSLEVTWRAEKGHNLWIGRDAARWSREAPNRLLNYSHGLGIFNRLLD